MLLPITVILALLTLAEVLWGVRWSGSTVRAIASDPMRLVLQTALAFASGFGAANAQRRLWHRSAIQRVRDLERTADDGRVELVLPHW